MTVSKLLSDADVSALHNHFLEVERERLSVEIQKSVHQLEEVTKTIPHAATWPQALPAVSKPPNRYQVSPLKHF